MTRMTPELPLLSPSSRKTPTGWRLTTTCDLAWTGSHTVEPGFEPRTLQPRSQDLATWLPWSPLQLQVAWHPQTTVLDPRLQASSKT
ncbi:hypothetical protein AVEN_174241-1 [Araneus ventricosus]|uniref:Uncharacterized protein n=1 Tax=Araneus ventricosus TaxID=182803 RepID=A0A4Y2LGA9_ARAVE|nr:hypothetical protein AVEN_174241-1 [Araneus ventricosus]